LKWGSNQSNPFNKIGNSFAVKPLNASPRNARTLNPSEERRCYAALVNSEPGCAHRTHIKHTAAGRALRDHGWTRAITDGTKRIAERLVTNNFEFGQTIGTVSMVDVAELHTFSPSSADFAG